MGAKEQKEFLETQYRQALNKSKEAYKSLNNATYASRENPLPQAFASKYKNEKESVQKQTMLRVREEDNKEKRAKKETAAVSQGRTNVDGFKGSLDAVFHQGIFTIPSVAAENRWVTRLNIGELQAKLKAQAADSARKEAEEKTLLSLFHRGIVTLDQLPESLKQRIGAGIASSTPQSLPGAKDPAQRSNAVAGWRKVYGD